MKKHLLLLFIVQIFFYSCAEKSPNFKKEELIGVWSGLLFQTESYYDSIILKPTDQPREAFLFKNGKQFDYSLVLNGNTLQFEGDSGLRFDAVQSEDKQELHAVLTDDLWAQSLDFEKVEDRWISKIHKHEIIDTDYKVYLEFYRDSIGDIQAKIQSNKENRNLHFTIKKVIFDGNDIDFEITNDGFGISAFYEATSKSLSLKYGNTGGKRVIQLTKLKENELEGYLPKVLTEKYEYKIPEPFDDSIQTASLEEVGIDTSMLEFMNNEKIKKLNHIHSIIITKDKKLVFEEYFHGYHRAYLHDIRSAFKSFASLAVGKAMMQKRDLNVNSTLTDYYPDYNIEDTQKNMINVHHALTMSTGIQLEDEDKMQWDNDDWVAYKLDLPMQYKPGEKYVYSSGGCNLLTGVIQHSTNQYLPLFIYEKILIPMRIKNFQMLTSPQGRGYLAGNFYLRPIDFTKFGLLVLDKGKYAGEQLITESWIVESTQPHISGGHPKGSEYGYLWRLLERNVNGKKVKTIEAWGNGGQFLIIIPELDVTVTFTGGNYNLFPEMEEIPFEILNDYILPAVRIQNN
ncbi:serine hydrolase domain-containing protein [Aquimarina algicola]|uniref:Serine hydrolase n=1 Tax=Aquimarina algicola TaxID=2589995 RepID=A0A504J6A6_9FLAO|nr:serine hydrolase [Aquimarina algicola]TPN81691.1 serine hydrolase [Aquimarina algicola]